MPSLRQAGHLRLVAPGAAGRGRCAAQHGELLQGLFHADGPLRPAVRAVVALPYGDVAVEAVARLTPADPAVEVFPSERDRAVSAAELTLRELGLAGGCRVELSGGVPAGRGLGASTADVVATVRAVAAAAGRVLPATTVARLAVTAEHACAPVMFGGQVTLFAHREGRVLEVLAPALPPLHVVGCDAGGDLAAAEPERYGPGDVEQVGYLLALLRRALRIGDAALLGRVATRSAALNQRFRPLAPFAELCRVAEETGAAGVQVAHRGTVAGLLYAAADPRARHRAEAGRLVLAGLGLETWEFTAGQAAAELDRAAG